MNKMSSLDEDKRGALDSRNALNYFLVCNKIGLDDNSVEDKYLFQEGFGIYQGNERKVDDILDSQEVKKTLETEVIRGPQDLFPDNKEESQENLEPKYTNEKLVELSRIANLSFPETSGRERVGGIEYRQRLSELNQAGWKMKPYSHLGKRYALEKRFEAERKRINELLKE